MKRCSTLLVLREMQTEIPLRIHYISLKYMLPEKTENTVLLRIHRNQNSCMLLMDVENDTIPFEKLPSSFLKS